MQAGIKAPKDQLLPLCPRFGIANCGPFLVCRGLGLVLQSVPGVSEVWEFRSVPAVPRTGTGNCGPFPLSRGSGLGIAVRSRCAEDGEWE